MPHEPQRTRSTLGAVTGPSNVEKCRETSRSSESLPPDQPRYILRLAQAVKCGADELACKPDPVHRAPCGIPAGGHPSRPAVAGRLQRPTRRHRAGHPRSPAQRAVSGAPFGLAPGGVYLAVPVTRDAGGLLHHRFTLTPLARGGLFSVALSRGSPRVAVSNHPALRSPDFPRRARCGARRDRPASSSAPSA